MIYSPEELRKLVFINELTFLSLKQKLFLLESGISLNELSAFSISDLSLLLKKSFRVKTYCGNEILKKTDRAIFIINKFSIGCVCFNADDFPALLKEMSDPPFLIFFRGNFEILKRKCISIVGTRRATRNAVLKAREFSKDACDKGFTVVSGLAFGIDLAAHSGALSSETPFTAAVLPSGIDTVSPSANIKTASKIIEKGGLILSEYTPGTPGTGFRCVQRDRIIAALSETTVVIQAPSGSGALITAKCALEYGRDVMFHEAAFEEDSQMLEKATKRNLENEIASGKKWSYKLDSNIEKFINEGAPVISSFDDFVKSFCIL